MNLMRHIPLMGGRSLMTVISLYPWFGVIYLIDVVSRCVAWVIMPVIMVIKHFKLVASATVIVSGCEAH